MIHKNLVNYFRIHMLIFIVFYTRAVKPKACAQLEHLGLREKTWKNSTEKNHHQ